MGISSLVIDRPGDWHSTGGNDSGQRAARSVEKVAATLVAVGVSNFLKAMLKAEEEKLRNLRRRLALLVKTPKGETAPEAHIHLEQVIDTMQTVASPRTGPAGASRSGRDGRSRPAPGPPKRGSPRPR